MTSNVRMRKLLTWLAVPCVVVAVLVWFVWSGGALGFSKHYSNDSSSVVSDGSYDGSAHRSGPGTNDDWTNREAPANTARLTNAPNQNSDDTGHEGNGNYPDTPTPTSTRSYPGNVPDHSLPLTTSESELRRLASDPALSLEIRSEAGLRLSGGFFDWPGRHGGRLGGFHFDPAKVTQLEGWSTTSDIVGEARDFMPNVAGAATRLPTGVTRWLSVGAGDAHMHIEVTVAVSVIWAQYRLLQSTAMSSSGTLPVIEKDGAVGDVWIGSPGEGSVSSGRFRFTRRNVRVDVQYNGRERDTLNLWRLAREIDFQIREQGVDAKEWADLGDICPMIHEFAVDDPVLHTHPLDKSRTPVRINVEPRPGMDIMLVAPDSRGLIAVDTSKGSEQVRLEIDLAKLYLEEKEPVAARTWLMACDRKSLLFSVAAIDIEIRR